MTGDGGSRPGLRLSLMAQEEVIRQEAEAALAKARGGNPVLLYPQKHF